jgi:hypothetical protein
VFATKEKEGRRLMSGMERKSQGRKGKEKKGVLD